MLTHEVGRGRYGIVYECKDKISGETFACKVIAKQKLKTRADIDTVRREVEIMHTLQGVENCVQLKVKLGRFESQHGGTALRG